VVSDFFSTDCECSECCEYHHVGCCGVVLLPCAFFALDRGLEVLTTLTYSPPQSRAGASIAGVDCSIRAAVRLSPDSAPKGEVVEPWPSRARATSAPAGRCCTAPCESRHRSPGETSAPSRHSTRKEQGSGPSFRRIL